MTVNLQSITKPRWRGALGTALLLTALIPAVHAADSLPGTAPDLLAMMDDDMMRMMGEMMSGKMGGGMPPDKPMSGGMQAPMTRPSSVDPMGRMRGPAAGGMSGMAPRSGLPGFPGASHLYHVGSTGFFLDHPEHITLATAQQTTLNRIKEKSLLDRASSDRRIEDAEQELWTLTAADSPDGAKIEATIRSIEKSRGDQRMAFIRAVGEASTALTPDQRAALLGTGTKPAAGVKPPAAAKPAPMKPMKDM